MAVSRILLVSGAANFSTRDVWEGYRVGLSLLGIDVVPYPTFSMLKVLSPESVCSDILGTALDVENRIDCVIFIDGLYFRGKRSRIPLSIRRAGIPTVLIATDDPYEEMSNVDALYTHRFTNELTCRNDEVDYLPTASVEFPTINRLSSPRYAVSFLGTVFEDRLPFLLRVARYCEQQQRRFLIAGKILCGLEDFQKLSLTELRQRTIENPEKWEIYANSLTTLNIFRDSETAQSASPRVYEVTAFGHAALLSGPKREEVNLIYGPSVYYFSNEKDLIVSLEESWNDEQDRLSKTEIAKQITLKSHLYEHRAGELLTRLRSFSEPSSKHSQPEHQIGWIIGCGRTGSTWLAEMLGDLPHVRRWHEPYFGRFFKHLHDRPEDYLRPASFFSQKHETIWLEGIRRLFFEAVADRYPQLGKHGLFIKEVNTPELYGWLQRVFPAGRMIHLIRDPFDTLDSYLDLQKPGSWNDQFGDQSNPLHEPNVRRTANHICSTMELAREAYEAFPVEQKIQISYESLLTDPTEHLIACCKLISIEVDPAEATRIAEHHHFKKHQKTGTLEFRRKGKSGVWKESENFTGEVVQIANEILGPLRKKLGY